MRSARCLFVLCVLVLSLVGSGCLGGPNFTEFSGKGMDSVVHTDECTGSDPVSATVSTTWSGVGTWRLVVADGAEELVHEEALQANATEDHREFSVLGAPGTWAVHGKLQHGFEGHVVLRLHC